MPTLSVLLPVRNGGAFVLPAIRSVLYQTERDFELLVLDDGSTDGTVERVRSLRDPRITVLAGDGPRGLAMRLNEGIAAARAPFIARMDADDLCFPSRFEAQLRALTCDERLSLVSVRALLFDTPNQALGLSPWYPGDSALIAQPWRGIAMPHPGWMGRAEWFRRFMYRVPEVRFAEDQELLLRALPESRYRCLPDVLLAYRHSGYGWSRTARARAALLRAQSGLFIRRGQIAYAALAAFSAATGVSMAALKPLTRHRLARRPVPADVAAALRRLVLDCASPVPEVEPVS